MKKTPFQEAASQDASLARRRCFALRERIIDALLIAAVVMLLAALSTRAHSAEPPYNTAGGNAAPPVTPMLINPVTGKAMPPNGSDPFIELPISFSGSGDNTIQAGSGATVITVWAIRLSCASATGLIVKNGSTAVTGTMTLGFWTEQPFGMPLFTLSPGAAWKINSSNAVTCGGWASITQQ